MCIRDRLSRIARAAPKFSRLFAEAPKLTPEAPKAAKPEAPKKGCNSCMCVWMGLGAAAIGGGYWYYMNNYQCKPSVLPKKDLKPIVPVQKPVAPIAPIAPKPEIKSEAKPEVKTEVKPAEKPTQK